MNAFLNRILKGNGIIPTEICAQSFRVNFADAVNVEWYKRRDHYEAVFYRQNLEHIALFSLEGVLLEYKQNLPSEYLPEALKKLVLSKGEIMNSVLINRGNLLEYEFIVRDSHLKRRLVVLSDVGTVKAERPL